MLETITAPALIEHLAVDRGRIEVDAMSKHHVDRFKRDRRHMSSHHGLQYRKRRRHRPVVTNTLEISAQINRLAGQVGA